MVVYHGEFERFKRHPVIQVWESNLSQTVFRVL